MKDPLIFGDKIIKILRKIENKQGQTNEKRIRVIEKRKRIRRDIK